MILLNKILIIILMFFCLPLIAGQPSCESKYKAIKKHISKAKKEGNYYQVMKLEKSLQEVETYCNKGLLSSPTKKNRNKSKY